MENFPFLNYVSYNDLTSSASLLLSSVFHSVFFPYALSSLSIFLSAIRMVSIDTSGAFERESLWRLNWWPSRRLSTNSVTTEWNNVHSELKKTRHLYSDLYTLTLHSCLLPSPSNCKRIYFPACIYAPMRTCISPWRLRFNLVGLWINASMIEATTETDTVHCLCCCL